VGWVDVRAGSARRHPASAFRAASGSAGVSVRILAEVVADIGERSEFIPDEFAHVLDALLSGKLDMVANVGWPNPYFDGKGIHATRAYARFEPAIFVWDKGATFQAGRRMGNAYFQGLIIAVQQGSFVSDCLKGLDCTIVPVDNDMVAFTRLVWGHVDAAITERKAGLTISGSYFHGDITVGWETGMSRDVVCS